MQSRDKTLQGIHVPGGKGQCGYETLWESKNFPETLWANEELCLDQFLIWGCITPQITVIFKILEFFPPIPRVDECETFWHFPFFTPKVMRRELTSDTWVPIIPGLPYLEQGLKPKFPTTQASAQPLSYWICWGRALLISPFGTVPLSINIHWGANEIWLSNKLEKCPNNKLLEGGGAKIVSLPLSFPLPFLLKIELGLGERGYDYEYHMFSVNFVMRICKARHL